MNVSSRRILWVVCISVLVVLLLLFLPWGRVEEDVRLPESSGVVSDSETLSPTTTPTHTVNLAPPLSEPSEAQPAETEIAREIPSPGSLHIRIVDAIGDPIAIGQVAVDGREFSFSGGELDIFGLEPGKCTMVASADGYDSATRTINVPANEDVVITLEYLCSFEIGVYSSQKFVSPIAGAEVIVWNGLPVRRPVGHEAAPNVYLVPDEADLVRLHRDESGIHVIGVESYSGIRPDDFDPEAGDLVVGISGNMWRPGDQTTIEEWRTVFTAAGQSGSTRLRIWDAIIAYGKANPSSRHDDFIEFERDGSRHICTTGKMNTSQRGEIAARGTTDSDGRCRFENLPARTYFVQAHKENQRTNFGVIHPARGGGKIYMADSCTLYVTVKYSAVSLIYEEGGISGTHVHLKSSDESESAGMRIGRTDKAGRVCFEAVPWGRYQLTATPPRNLYLGSKTIDITLQEPQQSFSIQFGSKSYVISGTVLTADTKEPVPGFLLELRNLDLPLPRSTTSKRDGSFAFTVYRPGEYEIRPIVSRDGYKGYLPTGWGLSLGDHTKAILKVSVEDKDVEGLEYLVLAGVKTRFRGKVTTTDGSPVSGIDVFLSVPKYVTASGGTTGEDGRFDLSVYLPPDDMEHREEIAASIDGPRQAATMLPPVEYRDVQGNSIGMTLGGRFWPGPPRKVERGVSPVEFRVGDTVSNIHIIMRKADDAPALVGTITTEDGKWPVEFQIRVIQNDRGLDGQLELDHSFRVDWVQPGPFWLHIAGSMNPRLSYGEFGLRQTQPYCSQSLEMEMPPDQKTLQVDIVVPTAGHLAGRVIDKEGQPVMDAKILVHGTELSPGQSITDILPFFTDENGLFWVYGQRIGKEHTIEVIPPDATEPATRLEGIEPPEQNIVVVIDDSK
ncbi:MAG: carboxypeptidase regulatory-like domain-containing protein [bacterium]